MQSWVFGTWNQETVRLTSVCKLTHVSHRNKSIIAINTNDYVVGLQTILLEAQAVQREEDLRKRFEEAAALQATQCDYCFFYQSKLEQVPCVCNCIFS